MASDRRGSFYMMMLVGAIALIGFVAALQLQMDQQVSRARHLKAGAEAALVAREGVVYASQRLTAAGTLPFRFTEPQEGGDLVVVSEGPRPPGSRKYVVFARARFLGGAVTAVADLRFGSPSSAICNLDMLYQDVDVDSAVARGRVIDARREARRALKSALIANRGEGSGLPARLSGFLSAVSGGTIPHADQARIASALVTPLTTDVP